MRLRDANLALWSCLATIVLLGATLPARQSADAAQKAREDAKEIEAIRAVIDAQMAAWNRGDLEAFMGGYWKSPQLSFSSGKDKTRGWQATFDRYKKRYQGEGREMGQLAFSELEIEMLGPDSAFVRGRWQLKLAKESPGGLFTLVFRKLPDGWRIVHDHTSN